MVPAQGRGPKIEQAVGPKKAKIVVARKLAIILHNIWTDGTEFWWRCDQPDRYGAISR